MVHSFHPVPAVRMVQTVLMAVALCVLLIYYGGSLGKNLPVALLVVVFMALLSIAMALLRSRFETITLDDKTISHTIGILSTRRTIVPFAKVTEAKYSQGILHRILGVGTLRVDSAGGSDVAINVEDIRKSELELIMGAINEKAHVDKGE